MANYDRHCFRCSPSLTKKIDDFLTQNDLPKSDFFRSLLMWFFLYYDNNQDIKTSFDSFIKRLRNEGLI